MLELRRKEDSDVDIPLKNVSLYKYSLVQVNPESQASTRTEVPTQFIEPAGKHVRLRIRIPYPHETFEIWEMNN